jgi:hypothetical protein
MSEKNNINDFRFSNYCNTILGKYDFSGIPSVTPEFHTNSIELLATSEHEQIHDMLARQTTHGYAILLTNVFIESNPDLQEEPKKMINSCLEETIKYGRSVHERYALFGTLKTNRLYEPLINNLPEDYQDYLNQAIEIIPPEIQQLRLGRIFLYACVLCSLSPQISVPQKDTSKNSNLLDYMDKVNNCEKRWQKISKWKTHSNSIINNEIIRLAKKNGYSQIELSLPIFFEDTFPLLDSDENRFQSFIEHERLLIYHLSKYISEKTQKNDEQVLLQDELKDCVKLYRDLLSPSFRLDPILTEYLKLDENKFGDIHRLFQDKPQSKVRDIITKHNFGKNAPAVIRIIREIFNRSNAFSCVGFFNNQLESSLKEKMQSHLNVDTNIYIKWCFLFNDIEFYNNEKLETLYLFHINEFVTELTDIEFKKKLPIISTPYHYFADNEISCQLKFFEKNNFQIYVTQPLNFLNLLEWRIIRNLSISQFSVIVLDIVGELYYLVKIIFNNETVIHISLCTYSYIIGLHQLKKLPELDIRIIENKGSKPDSMELGLINYLKIYWRTGYA